MYQVTDTWGVLELGDELLLACSVIVLVATCEDLELGVELLLACVRM